MSIVLSSLPWFSLIAHALHHRIKVYSNARILLHQHSDMQLARLCVTIVILAFSFRDVCYALKQPHWRLREQLVAPEAGVTLPNDPQFIQVRDILDIMWSILDLVCVSRFQSTISGRRTTQTVLRTVSGSTTPTTNLVDLSSVRRDS